MATIVNIPTQGARVNLLSAGKVLKIDRPAYTHYGIVDRFGMVIHNSKQYGGVVRESYDNFAKNEVVYESKITSAARYQAALKAEKHLGKRYDLIDFNCEHLVRDCHENRIKSHQIEKLFIAIGAAVVAWKSPNPTVRAIAGGIGLGAVSASEIEKPSEKAIWIGLGVLGVIGLIALARK